MALYSIQGETLGEIADAIREQTGTEEPIQTNEMSSMIRQIEGGSPNAVLYTEQSLTDEQKAQARENIGAAAIGEGSESSENAVLYTEQDLTLEQKNQARKNIDIHVGEEPADADEGAVWIDPDGMNLILGNAIMAEDVNEGDVEIFGSFISEDSVIAKDENSDGNINLQTFVKGEGPSIEYATKEELAALTAEDVGARPDTWMPTVEQVGAAATSHNHSAGDITSGTLPFERGGTGASTALVNAPINAIIRKPTDGNYLYYTATNNGALYATSANGLPKFGTLPIAQGGTGATNASAALSKLGGVQFQQKTIAAGSSVKIVTGGTNLLMCRLSTSAGTAGVYAITAYSENRAPAIAQLASAANVTVATGGSNDAGWYTTVTAGSSGSVYLTVYGGCTIT